MKAIICYLAPFWPLLLILFFLAGCHQRGTLRIGDTPERVELDDIQGKKVILPDDFKGKVVMLRFSSIECPSCCKEMIKTFESLYRKYRDQGFVMVVVDVTHPCPNSEEFEKFGNISFPILTDPDNVTARRFGVTGLPTTFILDPEGVVREKIVGETSIDHIEKLVTTVLYKGGFYDTAY